MGCTPGFIATAPKRHGENRLPAYPYSLFRDRTAYTRAREAIECASWRDAEGIFTAFKITGSNERGFFSIANDLTFEEFEYLKRIDLVFDFHPVFPPDAREREWIGGTFGWTDTPEERQARPHEMKWASDSAGQRSRVLFRVGSIPFEPFFNAAPMGAALGYMERLDELEREGNSYPWPDLGPDSANIFTSVWVEIVGSADVSRWASSAETAVAYLFRTVRANAEAMGLIAQERYADRISNQAKTDMIRKLVAGIGGALIGAVGIAGGLGAGTVGTLSQGLAFAARGGTLGGALGQEAPKEESAVAGSMAAPDTGRMLLIVLGAVAVAVGATILILAI